MKLIESRNRNQSTEAKYALLHINTYVIARKEIDGVLDACIVAVGKRVYSSEQIQLNCGI